MNKRQRKKRGLPPKHLKTHRERMIWTMERILMRQFKGGVTGNIYLTMAPYRAFGECGEVVL